MPSSSDTGLPLSSRRDLTATLKAGGGLEIPGGTETARVVILEEFLDLGDTYREILTWRGHTTRAIEHSPNGIALAKQLRPQVALVNLGGSSCRGVATCRELLNSPGLEDCAVIVMTVLPTDASRRAAYEAGAKAYVKRPMSPQELISLIEDALKT